MTLENRMQRQGMMAHTFILIIQEAEEWKFLHNEFQDNQDYIIRKTNQKLLHAHLLSDIFYVSPWQFLSSIYDKFYNFLYSAVSMLSNLVNTPFSTSVHLSATGPYIEHSSLPAPVMLTLKLRLVL